MGTILVCLVLSSSPTPVAAPAPTTTALTPEEIQDIKDEAAAQARAEAQAEAEKRLQTLQIQNAKMAEKLRATSWKVVQSGPKYGVKIAQRVDLSVKRGGTLIELECYKHGSTYACLTKGWTGCMIMATTESILLAHGCKDMGTAGTTPRQIREGIMRDLHKILGQYKQ